MPAVVPPVTLPNHFTFIAHFKGADGQNTWRNSIVIEQTSGAPAPTDPIVDALILFFKHNLITTATYDHSELRNWSRGDIPFSTEGFLWTTTNNAGPGLKTAVAAYGAEGSEGVGKEVCYFIRVSPTTGKEGKLFLRALADNADVAAQPGGPWVPIVPGPPNVTPAKFNAIVLADIAAYFPTTNPGLRVVHFSEKDWNASHGAPADAPFSVPISTMTMVGPTINKPNRRSRR